MAELDGDVIESIAGLDRVFVYDVSYGPGDVSVVRAGGQTLLVADTGRPGERLELVLAPGIGLAPQDYRLFTLPRGPDTIIIFAQSDDFSDGVAGAESFAAEGVNSFESGTGLVYGTIETAGDVDVFDNFDTEFSDLLIEVLGASAGGGTLANPRIDILDASGAVVMSDAGSGPGGAARVVIPASDDGNLLTGPEDLYIAVRGAAGQTGTYTLRGIIADDHKDTLPAFGGFLGTEQRYELTLQSTPVSAEIETAGDADVFAISLAAGATYRFDATGLPNRYGSVVDTRLELLDDTGAVVLDAGNGGGGTDARLVHTAAAQGDYYLRVTFPAPQAARQTGPYELTLHVSDDHADTPFEAANYKINGGTIAGITETGSDRDFFGVWLVAGETYTFQGQVPLSGNTLRLFSPAIGELARTDISFWGESFQHTATVTGLHYVSMQKTFGVGGNGYTMTITGGPQAILGTPRSETLPGTPFADEMRAFGGADRIEAGAGNDTIYGGPAGDTIFADGGHDRVWGDNGPDRVYLGTGNDRFSDNGQGGGSGRDTVFGGPGNDTILGGGGDDSLQGDKGEDSLEGGAGNDILRGGAHSDILRGGEGHDSVWGGEGKDLVYLNAGNDLFTDSGQGGAHGSDTVYGGNGRDTLVAGGGNDTFTGGPGGDRFVFAGAFQRDVIADFQDGLDLLDVTGWASVTSLADLVVRPGSGGVEIFETGRPAHMIVLQGLTTGQIGAADFDFV